MARIFRSFRKQMIVTGGLKKYLIYAIGEIVLVVIGILIALSINNYNNRKLLRQMELKVYENIRNQIAEDEAVLQNVIAYNNTYITQFDFANKIIGEDSRDHIDTLARIAPNLFRYSDFNKSGNIYQNLVNSGDIKLLKNADIVEAIQELEEHYIHINRLEENHFKVILQFGSISIVENVNFNTGEVERPDDIYSFKFQNLLLGFLDIMDEKNEIYNRALTKIEVISKLVEEELRQ